MPSISLTPPLSEFKGTWTYLKLILFISQLTGGTASMLQLKERIEKDLLEVKFTEEHLFYLLNSNFVDNKLYGLFSCQYPIFCTPFHSSKFSFCHTPSLSYTERHNPQTQTEVCEKHEMRSRESVILKASYCKDA